MSPEAVCKCKKQANSAFLCSKTCDDTLKNGIKHISKHCENTVGMLLVSPAKMFIQSLTDALDYGAQGSSEFDPNDIDIRNSAPFFTGLAVGGYLLIAEPSSSAGAC